MARISCLAALAACLVLSSSVQAAPTPPATTKAAITELDSWLGKGANGDQWRKYLGLDSLKPTLEGSSAPDLAVLRRVVDRLKSSAPGLDRPQFAKLRSALEDWVADLSAPAPADLPEAVKKAAGDYHPPSIADLERAKQKLERRLTILDGYLAKLGKVGPGWRKYLEIDNLRAQLKPAAPPNPKQLDEIVDRFNADKPGLEIPDVRQAADALNEYAELAAVVGDDQLQAEFNKQLESLAEWVGKYVNAPSEQAAAEVSRRLGWLQAAHLDRGLVRDVRHHYLAPNFFATIQEPLVAAGIAQSINDTMALNDSILGTQISGTGRTVGKVRVELVPDPNRALFDALLTGTVNSNTVGHNGPATIHSQGTTQIAGRKRVRIDANGIYAYPATAAAVTRTRITGIHAGGSIANRIANDRVYEQKGQAERVGSTHAEQRIRARLDAEFDPTLVKANRDFQEKFRHPLIRRRQFPPLLNFATTEDLIEVVALAAVGTQLGAPNDAPSVEVDKYDMTARLHESAANNLATDLLAGVTLDSESVKEQIIKARGSLPDDLKDDENQEPWSITFARFRPISVSLRDGGVEVTVRGSSYTSGDRKFKAMNVRAVYKVEATGVGAKFVRQGDLEITPPNFDPAHSTLSAQQVALRTILQKKFGKLFKAESVSEGVELPGRWKQAGKLGLAQLRIDGGWAVLGWRLVPPAATPAKTAMVEVERK